MSKASSNFLYLLGGAAIGATLGILFAPDKGVRTRRRIGAAAQNFKDSIAERFEDLVDTAEEFVDDLKGAAADFSDHRENAKDKDTIPF